MDIFNELIKILTPHLKQIGFSKKRYTFYLEVDKNYGVVNFQKSRESTKEVIKFSINFGVYSNTLRQLDYWTRDLVKPDEVDQCHWHSRVSSFMPRSSGPWLNVVISDDLNSKATFVMELIQSIILPEINKRLSDEGLINCWMNKEYTGTTELGRFKNLTTLLKVKGDYTTLHQVVEEFMERSKGKSIAHDARLHLNKIRENG
ncbi:MAG: DUF4304 domain-containing protein [Candidatus Kapaibacterium sp.]